MTKTVAEQNPDSIGQATKKEALQATAPLIQESQALTRITTPEQYEQASLLRSKVLLVKKTWTERLDKIIKPAHTVWVELCGLKRDVLAPMDAAESRLTEGMKEFKREEARQLREAEQERIRREDELERQRVEKERAAEAAKTKQMAGRLQAQAERLRVEQQQVAEAPVAEPIRAVGSSTRTIKKWRCVDLLALAKAVGAGEVPEDCIIVNTVRMNQYFRDSPKDVAEIPGITIEEDVQIVNR